MKKNYQRLIRRTLLCFSGLSCLQARALSLDDYLKKVLEKNPEFESYKVSKEGSELKKEIGDLDLSPFLTSKIAFQSEQKPQPLPFWLGKAWEFDLGVAKRFSTGTLLSVNWSQGFQRFDGQGFAVPPAYVGSWTFAVSQSLWKDFLGSATRLRRDRENTVSRLEKLSIEAQARGTLVNAEAAYWNYVFRYQDQKNHEESLARAQRLVTWAKRRAENGVGDSSDLLQAQSLEATRRLQLIGAQDELIAAQKAVQDLVEDKNFATQAPEGVGSQKREFNLGPNKLRLDALLAQAQAELQDKVLSEAKDALSPDLLAQGSFSTNSNREATIPPSISGSLNGTQPTIQAQVTFTMNLDFIGKSHVTRSYELAASAAKIKADRLRYESDSSVAELSRRYTELSHRIAAAEAVEKFQTQVLQREKQKLERGRSTTYQVITFEQNEAESETLLLSLNIQQRNLEAQLRNFVTVEEFNNL